MRLGKQSPAAPDPGPAPAPERTAAFVEGELTAARAKLEECREVLAAAEAGYAAALDVDRTAALAADGKAQEAKVDRDIAARAVARLEAELVPLLGGARTAAEAAARAALIADAEMRAERYATAFAQHYPDMVDRARLLIRLWAQAEIAREAAVQAGAALPPTDAFRGLPGRERQVLGRRREMAWRNPHGGVFGDDLQARIQRQPDGRGMLPGPRPIYATQQQEIEVTTFLPGRPARVAARLAIALALPSAEVGGPPGWAAPAKTDPRSILKELDRLEGLSPADDAPPEPKTARTPIGPPIDVIHRMESHR